MNWGEQVFRYCERGQDPSFWAEPINATSNLGFLIAAGLALRKISSDEPEAGAADRAALLVLIALVAMVGIGSFLFHTFATRWARLADVVPIGLFMAAYLAFALRTLLGCSRTIVAWILAGFMAASVAASSLACPASLRSVTDYAREPCLKGTIGYAPALLALVVTGALLRAQHPAGRHLLLAAGIFLAAMLLRWLDRDFCAATALLGRVRGTHALWHLLNAATVYVLLRAAIDATVRRRPPAADRGRG